MNAPRLRPLGIGEILDVAIKIYFRHIGTFLRIIVFVVLPAQIVEATILVSAGAESNSSLFDPAPANGDLEVGTIIVGYLVVFGLSLIANSIATGACFKAVADAYLGSDPDWKQSLRYAGRRLHSILWISILGGLITGIAVLALIVGAIYFLVAFTVAVPVLLTEGTKGSKALRRSMRLVSGRWWPTFGLILLGGILSSLAGFLIGGLVSALSFTSAGETTVVAIVVATVSGTIAAMLVTPLQAAYTTVLYFDLRVRKEAFDLQLLAGQLGIDAGAGAGALLPPPSGPPTGGEQPPYWPPPPGWKPTGTGTAAPAPPRPASSEEPPYWPPPPGWKPSGADATPSEPSGPASPEQPPYWPPPPGWKPGDPSG